MMETTDCVMLRKENTKLKATFRSSGCDFQCCVFRLVPDYIPEQSCGCSPLVTILEGAATR